MLVAGSVLPLRWTKMVITTLWLRASELRAWLYGLSLESEA